MHACNTVTVAQLLSVRDGEPVDAGALQHVERCEHCSQELSRLKAVSATLRALPELTAPVYDPASLRARSRRGRIFQAANAAGIVAVGALTAFLVAGQIANRYEHVASVDPPIEATEPDSSVNSLVIRSQELESRLRRLPQRPQVERASTSLTIDSLQDRIQWVDFQLSLAHEAGMTERQTKELWRDRVRLMDSLVTVRYAEAQRTAYLMPASGSSL